MSCVMNRNVLWLFVRLSVSPVPIRPTLQPMSHQLQRNVVLRPVILTVLPALKLLYALRLFSVPPLTDVRHMVANCLLCATSAASSVQLGSSSVFENKNCQHHTSVVVWMLVTTFGMWLWRRSVVSALLQP